MVLVLLVFLLLEIVVFLPLEVVQVVRLAIGVCVVALVLLLVPLSNLIMILM